MGMLSAQRANQIAVNERVKPMKHLSKISKSSPASAVAIWLGPVAWATDWVNAALGGKAEVLNADLPEDGSIEPVVAKHI